MILLLFSLLGFIDAPEPMGKWKVSYYPEIALIKNSGESLLFNKTEVYSYDQQGNLIDSDSLTLTGTGSVIPAAAGALRGSPVQPAPARRRGSANAASSPRGLSVVSRW